MSDAQSDLSTFTIEELHREIERRERAAAAALARDLAGRAVMVTCPQCNGAGWFAHDICSLCGGKHHIKAYRVP